MPKVGNKEYSYTKKGIASAKSDAKKKGVPIKMVYNKGGMAKGKAKGKNNGK